ncbi:MAG: FtsX-like permease family protein [Thermodesulfobacteriota bacterium]
MTRTLSSSDPASVPTHAAGRQVRLPLAKSVLIAFQSIRVRFLRSLITTLTLVAAVAFLAFVQSSIELANGLLATGDEGLREALIRAGHDLAPGQASIGSSAKERWIVILSLLVCTVGIVNAQLMAVTERFREIGTMKCLGALDRFVVRLFFLEAGMQGLAGAAAGALIGVLAAFLTAWVRFGPAVLAGSVWPALLATAGRATAVGCGLSLLGVVYPALVAARMQPVEAMRVEP